MRAAISIVPPGRSGAVSKAAGTRGPPEATKSAFAVVGNSWQNLSWRDDDASCAGIDAIFKQAPTGSDMSTPDTQVVIVGGGPVGLGLGIELGQRGIDCVLVERYGRP